MKEKAKQILKERKTYNERMKTDNERNTLIAKNN